MYDDDYRVTSVPYRLMPPRRCAQSGDLGAALGGVSGTEPVAPQDGAAFWPAARQWPRRVGRFLIRVDVWILIATVVCAIIACLTLAKAG